MKLINILTVETKHIDKVKNLIELWADKITDWDTTGKTYSVVDPIKCELVQVQVWTCLAEQKDFNKFAMAYATTIDEEVWKADVLDNLKSVL